MNNAILCLASASPRRRELLMQIGVPHLVQPADLDETPLVGEAPADYVERLARAKAQTVWRDRQFNDALPLPVLGADTTVTIDGQVLGKPNDETALRAMFERLSGREHEVWSAVALANERGTVSRRSCTRVKFRLITAAEVACY